MITLDEYIKALELIRATNGGSMRMTQPFRGFVINLESPRLKFMDVEGKYYLSETTQEPRGEKVVAI